MVDPCTVCQDPESCNLIGSCILKGWFETKYRNEIEVVSDDFSDVNPNLSELKEEYRDEDLMTPQNAFEE